MTQVILPVHSIVDVITNSSTSIYVEATKNTIKGIKELVDALLKVSNPNTNLTCDDVFDIELDYSEIDERAFEEWDAHFDDDNETTYKDKQELWETHKRNNPDWMEKYMNSSESYQSVGVIVTPKIDSSETKIASKILSDLTGLFNIEADYNS